MEGEWKKFYKKKISRIFSIIKNAFDYLFAVFLPNLDVCNLQPAVSNFLAYGQELLV